MFDNSYYHCLGNLVLGHICYYVQVYPFGCIIICAQTTLLTRLCIFQHESGSTFKTELLDQYSVLHIRRDGIRSGEPGQHTALLLPAHAETGQNVLISLSHIPQNICITFMKCWPKSKTLGGRCINVIQMFCVFWVTDIKTE